MFSTLLLLSGGDEAGHQRGQQLSQGAGRVLHHSLPDLAARLLHHAIPELKGHRSYRHQ